MGYNMISGINGIFNKITNKKYDEKEEFTETSPLWLQVIFAVVVGVVVVVVAAAVVQPVVAVFVKNFYRTSVKDRQYRPIKLGRQREILDLSAKAAAGRI